MDDSKIPHELKPIIRRINYTYLGKLYMMAFGLPVQLTEEEKQKLEESLNSSSSEE